MRKNYQALKLEADAQSQRQSEPRSKYDICAGLGGHILAALPKNHSPPKNNAKKKKKKQVLGIISGTWSCLALRNMLMIENDDRSELHEGPALKININD